MKVVQKFRTVINKKILYLIPSDQNDKGGMTEITKMFYQVGLFENTNIRHFNTFYKWGKSSIVKFFETIVHQIKFIKVLILFKPDAVFVMTSSYMGFFEKCIYCLVARTFGVKCMLNQVGDFANFYERNKIKAYFIRLCLKIPNVVIVGSSFWNNYFQSAFPNLHIEPIVNPVVSQLYFKANQYNNDKIRIVTVSTIIEAKGIIELTKVIQNVCLVSNNFIFIIMGRGEKLEWIQTELKNEVKMGLVEIRGQVSDEEKIQEFSLADIFILLSHNEVIPISILEAMSASLPILATSVGGIPDIVLENQNGFLFTRKTVEPVVNKIIEIGNDYSHQKLKEMGRKSHSIVTEKYDVLEVLKKHLELINKLV